MTNRTQNIREFIRESGSTIISVEFIKRNGDVRKICFNPRDRNEIKGIGTVNQNLDVIRIRDFAIAREHGKGAWRSFNVNNIVKITSNGHTYNFSDEVSV
jgi:hypothetical protein